jgi:anaerobic selenocysteine-containing dehydrogenase
MSYARLREGPLQWPCTDENPDGTERLYEDGRFFAEPDYCESYGRDLLTGAPFEESEYRALNPDGKALLKAAGHQEPHEAPSGDFPFWLITGRTLYHFHTRTKTGRAPQLQAAAPQVWVELSAGDAGRLGVAEGDLLEVSTPRGSVRARLRISGIRDGVVFLPFHYGYWDEGSAGPDGDGRAANELTLTDWDPVSKQPIFKTAAAAVRRVKKGKGAVASAPTTTASAPVGGGVPPTTGGPAAEAEQEFRAGGRR